jgi:hypothetical protein
MKPALNIVGGLMIALGVVWVLEGLKIAPGALFIPFLKLSNISWAGNGAWLILFGAGLLVWNNKAPTKV